MEEAKNQVTLLMDTKFSFAVRFPFNPSNINFAELEVRFEILHTGLELEPAGAGVVQQPPLLSEESLEADFFKGLVDVHHDGRIFVILKLKPALLFMFAHRAHLSPLIPSCCFVIF